MKNNAFHYAFLNPIYLLMKALLILVLTAFIYSTSSYAQHICGADHQHDLFLENSENRTKFALMNERILEQILLRRSGGGTNEVQVVPTVVHIIHNNGTENISLDQVDSAMLWLNEAYSNTGQSFNPDGVEIPIQFCLAQENPDGEFSTGVNYVESTLTDMLVPSQDLALKDLSRWDPTKYMNIWVVNSITREDNSPGVVGYATFPDSHGTDTDGIVLEAEYFGSSASSNNVLTHESGHYLGLFHTFQGGCPNDDCLTSGDMVCDTPPDQNLFNTFCFDGTNSCSTDADDLSENNPFRAEELGGFGDQFDQQTNYMDYSSVLCFDIFTSGQSERMHAALDIRSSLFDEDKCAPPCTNPVVASVSASTSVSNVGESVTYLNSSSNYSALQWFLDGIPVSTDENFVFTPTEQGNYVIEVELSNDSPGCFQVVSFNLQVACPISITVTPSSTNISVGATVEFDTSVIGATSFEWFVDNVSQATTEQFSFTFNDSGISSIYLIASNGECDVISQVWNVSVGSCSSGNEHNLWYWFNPDGNGFGFNFNDQPVSLLVQNPLLSEGHSKATICDDAGNLLFISTGVGVYDRNFDLVENGFGLLGNESSHFGTMFLKNPGDSREYYLFTNDSEENNFTGGIRYSIIDADANNGLGLVTDVKNQLIEVSSAEHVSIVKHCSLRDKWLVFYDIAEQTFKSYLIGQNGIATEPVETELNLELSVNAETQAIKASPQGDQLVYEKYLLNFNQATGTIESVIDLGEGFSAGSTPISHDFSPSGKALYILAGGLADVTLYQYDLTLPDELVTTPSATVVSDIQLFGKDMQKGKNDIIYLDQVFSGGLATISSPNLLGAAMDFQENAIFANALINGFGNHYHAYVAGSEILIDGDEIICAGTEHEFSVFGSDCIDGEIDWEFSGDGDFTVNANETVSASFPSIGEAILIAKTASECGEITDTLHISIIQGPELDLGSTIGYCASDPTVTLEMPSEFEYYLWSNESTEQSITLISPEPQIIEARAYYQGCYITDEIEILGELDGIIDLGPDQELCDGVAIVLDAGPGYTDYLWQDGTTGQTYTAFLGGTYSVTVSEPCAASDMAVIDECGQTINSVANEESLNSFLTYPNPVSDQLHLEFETTNSGQLSIEIVDVTGRLVYSEQYQSAPGQNTFTISVDTYASGEYVLSVKGDSAAWNEKFIVE
ncbi:MAG: M43 family zinc metalloprotease [Flavobacteriales bacterium]